MKSILSKYGSVFFALGVFLCGAALVVASDGFTASRATPVQITGPNGVCRRVTNNNATGASEYIPASTGPEWQSFYLNPPASVTVATCLCTLPWGGTIAEGQSTTAYLASSASSCSAETRTCSNGVLSGSYQYQTCTPTCTGKSCGCTGKSCSDARLKTLITPLGDASGLASIEKLRPITFRWKDAAQDAAEGEQLGFIAQEVERVFPDLVTTQKGSSIVITHADGTTETVSDPKLMNYAQMVVPLVKAVQELQAENEALRARIEALERGR